MKRAIPILPTIFVFLAALVMVGLGLWQLDRRQEKERLIALSASNPSRPAVAFPVLPPVAPEILFRRSSVHCLSVVGWDVVAGRAADGSVGYRHIARCSTGAEGPGVLVAVGVGQKPDEKPAWSGGQVDGWIAQEPDHRPLIGRIAGQGAPLLPMLIARTPPAGLKPIAPPRAEDLPNNHLAYAVQWFLFAAIAIGIYALVLRRRGSMSQG